MITPTAKTKIIRKDKGRRNVRKGKWEIVREARKTAYPLQE